MNKNEAKEILESYVYDMKFYDEKNNEREKRKEKVLQSIRRVKELEAQTDCKAAEARRSLERMLEIEAKEESVLVDILTKKQLIEEIIGRLCSLDRTLLYMRYIQRYTFDQIAYKLNYSTKRVYQLHNVALGNFAALYHEDGGKIAAN